jgi:hypothetical protein
MDNRDLFVDEKPKAKIDEPKKKPEEEVKRKPVEEPKETKKKKEEPKKDKSDDGNFNEIWEGEGEWDTRNCKNQVEKCIYILIRVRLFVVFLKVSVEYFFVGFFVWFFVVTIHLSMPLYITFICLYFGYFLF